MWPVRTGILVDGGVAYFGAGIFPHENVYMCAVDAVDGHVIWRNDNISHREAGREDLSPQGYLLASPEHIYVPSGRTKPKSFDRRTGELLGAAMTSLGISSGTVAGTSAIMIGGRCSARCLTGECYHQEEVGNSGPRDLSRVPRGR